MDTPIIALTGKDTIAIDGQPFLNFASGDAFTLEYPNDLSSVEVGKNGNVASALNANGKKAECVLRLLRGSPEDIYLTTREQEYYNDPPSFVAYTGNFVKRIGDGSGNVNGDNYVAAFGVPKKLPMVKENTSGDVTQAITEHFITFGQAIRAIL